MCFAVNFQGHLGNDGDNIYKYYLNVKYLHNVKVKLIPKLLAYMEY